MYSELLVLALDRDRPPDEAPTIDEALVRLRQCRVQRAGTDPRPSTEGELATLIDDLAYDVALICLARLVGVECGAEEFDLPEKGRARLERALCVRGIDVDATHVPAKASERLARAPCPPLTT